MGAKCRFKALRVLIANPIKHPKNLNISIWIGVTEIGLSIKQSLFYPWLFLLLGVFINKGNTSDSNS